MSITIHQSICINLLKVESVTNSSVLQIGSAGSIRSRAELYNTGGFTGPAPLAKPQEGEIGTIGPGGGPMVPLSAPGG
ncbi:putative spore germination protein GerPB [Thalassobacillus devorans]|uniref:Spore germination protein GerPB n=1 Tax=Thalassobacillus devorans TaxID=279813 RepID=A0ABQ1NE89_9BACI|nr:spore germination protein GerPB [Thalassobacillus devorans]NIK27013.1 spore germination protein PB [Thalassobacillus devorans]GGC74185.1 putative spore germination protein GerPB [Thalassobacillus devorans]